MPFNGSGTFNRLYSWIVDAANGVDISSTRTDAEMNGFAAGLTNCITRDGQSPPSADLPMGGKKLTNLGNAASDTDALNRITADGRYAQTSIVITFNNAGSGAASGATYNGTAPVTISYNSIGAAPLASPTFTGTPAAPTATVGTNSTQIATTAFVAASFAPLASPALTGSPTAPTQTAGDNSTKLATTAFVAASFAPLVSPALTGSPTAPTQSVGDGSTKIATTAFVAAAKAPNVQSVTSAGTVTPTFSNDLVDITAQAAALTLANPTGTAVNGWGIVIRIKDNGSPQAITYGSQYVGIGIAKPTTTVAGKVLILGMIYNSTLTRWELVSAAEE